MIASALVEDDVTSYVTEHGTRQLGGDRPFTLLVEGRKYADVLLRVPEQRAVSAVRSAIWLTGAITYVMLRTDKLD